MNMNFNANIPEIYKEMNYSKIEPLQEIINNFNPENLDTLNQLIFMGEKCLANSDFEGAEDMINKAYSIDPSSVRLIRLRGLFHMLKKESDLAIPYFNQLLDTIWLMLTSLLVTLCRIT
jgi:tetratricopeptide (TPR) repeat protein